MPKRAGRKSKAQTPAPPSERIVGSKKNPKGSAASEKSASKIKLNEKTLTALKNKLSEFKKEHPNKKNITLNDLKAVYRRGAGAYSKSHRPTITGGVPNSRNAWSMARVNKFLKKAGGAKVKAAYVQDDDLMKMDDGGAINEVITCKNCGWSWKESQTTPSEKYICHKCGFDNQPYYRKEVFLKEGGSTLLAPNGKPSNLTPEQYKLVRTPEFKAWFGDWENDPENASKVVDENGEPLVVYRGVNPKPLAEGFNPPPGSWDYSRQGYQYFAKNRNYSRMFGITKPFFLNIRDLLDFNYYNDILIKNGIYREYLANIEGIFQISGEIEAKRPYLAQIIKVDNEMPELADEIINKLKTADGFHGYEASYYGEEESYVVKNANQIKLADGSNTTFNVDNDDARYVEGGRVGGFEDLEDEWLSKKIEIFLDKAKPYKFYFVDPKTNSLIVGFDEYVTQEHLEKFYLEATSSKEFFHGNSVEAKFNKETGDTIFKIRLRNKVIYHHGGSIDELHEDSIVYKIVNGEVGSINPNERYILSHEREIKFRWKEQLNNRMKPDGLWYSFGSEWADWVSREMPKWGNDYDYLHKIDVTNRVLRLDTIEKCLEFTEKFGELDRIGDYLINWYNVSKVYSGIEVTEPRKFWATQFHNTDKNTNDYRKLWWLYGWDVGSGCIWREDGIESIELVYGDEYANGGEINSKDDVNVPLYHGTTKEVWQNSEYETYLYVTDDFEIAKKYALEHEHGNPIVIKIDPNKIKNLKWDVDCDYSDEVCQEVGLITWQDSFNKKGTFAIAGKYDVNDFEIIEITKDYAKGGEVDEKVIKERWAKKKDSLMNMADNIRSLRTNLRKDLKSDNDKDRLTALAISLMDKTAERVGNDESEANGHLGITGLSKRNVKVESNTITLKYVGKSGVKHEKQFSDEGIANALKDAIANSQSKYVFENSDGFRIKNDRVNRYLSEYDITAKDLRGYSANQWIVSKLREVKDKEILGDEAKRKKKFNEIVKSVAEKVGHGAPTLKKHYMLPSLEREWVNHGRIVDLSNIKRAFKRGGDVGVGNINQGGSVINNIDYDHLDESQDLPNDGEGVFKKGGEIKFNDTIIYHEEKGNFFVPKNTVYAWLYDDPNAGKKLNDGEYDFVLFPPGGGIGLLGQKGYVPPLLKVWRKSYQDKTKGSDKLIGIVKAWYDEENKKLYIDMMTTKRQWRRKGVNSHIIKELREMFNLNKDQIVFDKPTDEGKKFMASGKYAKGGELSDENKKEIYKKWKSLINMSKSELEKFYNSEEGKVAGLTPQQAKSQGIDSGRESARWIMKMKSTSVKDWTPTMWKWAKKQISFVSRMSGNKGPLYDEKGNKTRKHTSLLIWGHNPKKKAQGGEIESQLNNLNMNEVTYNQLPAINDLGVGKKFVLKEHFYGNEGGKPTHRGCRYLIVENMGDAQMADCLKLKVHHAFGGGGVTTRGIITRPIKNIMNKGRDMGESLASGVEKAFKKGGELDPDKKEVKEYFEHKSGAAGGLLVGKRHSEGGIQAINKSTGQPLEMEGGEVVITRDAVSDSTLHDFNGKQMTNREILSAINESGGGVKFADGGDVSCKCSGKEYKLGGKTYKDYELFNKINNGYGSTSAIKKGMEVEDKEHGETFKLLKNGEITYEQFLKKLVVDHLSENPKYYDK